MSQMMGEMVSLHFASITEVESMNYTRMKYWFDWFRFHSDNPIETPEQRKQRLLNG